MEKKKIFNPIPQQVVCSVIVALIWYLFPLTSYNIKTLCYTCFSFVVFDNFIIGVLFSSFYWVILNKVFKLPNKFLHRRTCTWNYDVEPDLEFCFKAYEHGFLFLLLGDMFYIPIQVIRQFFHNWFVTIFLTNLFFAFTIYRFISGINKSLYHTPFKTKITKIIVFVIVVIFYILSLIYSINCGNYWFYYHFGEAH